MITAFVLFFAPLAVAIPKQFQANCDINPNLPFCDNQKPVAKNKDESNDQRACNQLRSEYYMNCTGVKKKRDEFCAAYENICVRGDLAEFGLNDESSSKTIKKSKKRKTKKKPVKHTVGPNQKVENVIKIESGSTFNNEDDYLKPKKTLESPFDSESESSSLKANSRKTENRRSTKETVGRKNKKQEENDEKVEEDDNDLTTTTKTTRFNRKQSNSEDDALTTSSKTSKAAKSVQSSSGKIDQESSATSRKATKSSKTSESSKPSETSEKGETEEKDYSEFCAEYKRRFLYVCPDPFRFGQRAAVFCPVYAERCHVPLPDKPIVPTDPPPPTSEDLVAQNPFAQQICNQYQGFAASYCQNLAALQMGVVRDGCNKYQRYCTKRGGTVQNGSNNFNPWNRPVSQPQNFVAPSPWSTQVSFQPRPFPTGLPGHPSNESFFNAECENPRGGIEKCETNTACYEASFAVAYQYAIVRGCVEQFTGDNKDFIQTYTPFCEYAQSSTPIYTDTTDHVDAPYIGVKICNTKDCNSEITSHAATKAQWGSENGVVCNLKTSIQCISCKYFDGYGHCWWDTQNFCTGAYCIKNIGTVNGRRYEIRGCAGIRPLHVDYCYDFEDEKELLFLGEHLALKTKGTQCVCDGGRCNDSPPRVSNTISYIFTIIIMVILTLTNI
ncbi:unnamed protein product [Bursaphelenchus okinawaensis]|uniref:Uncharacterized protein n=1 Tax=Bursaphelenchus okinawaensis TaxID=465554 RepID=A0A811K5H5_9BILA|nr:unnamed protein product [Bursaphelenchus okinawaensis]CAG9091792.1 unnamed protein product [Bursaphelenchus okinawaensis]